MNSKGKPVAVVIGATSKWQSDGRNTHLVHGGDIDDSDLPVGVRWGVGGAISLKFAQEGFFTVLTTRNHANAAPLEAAIREAGDDAMIVELDLASRESISNAFDRIRKEAGDPDVLVYNAGYLEGRDLPPEMELMENIPFEMYETAQHIASSGPFLVAKEVLPSMREKGQGTILISNNNFSLRGRKRYTGQSLYYPRVLMRGFAQALDRGVFRARRPRRQRGHRRHDRFPGNASHGPCPAESRSADEPGQDRRGLLLPAHAGQVLLDPRTPVDTLPHQAELLRLNPLLPIPPGEGQSGANPQPN